MRLYSVVRFTVTGFHLWPDAPKRRDYLATRHRHLFHVEVKLQVFGTEREVEFHDLLDYAKSQFQGGELGAQSCEMMAGILLEKITDHYSGRLCQVSIFEDGENGGLAVSFPGSSHSS